MEQFEVNLVGEILTIMLVAEGTYSVYRGNTFVADLTAKFGESGVTWYAEGITPEYAKQIGELIEEHDM